MSNAVSSSHEDTVGERMPSDEPRPPWHQRLELGHVALFAVLIAFVALTVRPITDIDSYWHVLVGRELLETGRFAGLGDAWSLYSPEQAWQTSQWAAEVAMAWIVDTFGWSGLVWARTVAVLALLGALSILLLRRAAPTAAAATLALVAIPSNAVLQERPLLVSFLLLVWVSGACFDLLHDRRAPSLLVAGLGTLVWAQFHGMWVLAPFSFGVVAVALLLERGEHRAQILQSVKLAAVTAVAGCVSPVGPAGLILPLTFRSATDQIAEWQKVPFISGAALGLLTMAAILFVNWARRAAPARLALIAFAGVWLVVGMSAYRNVMPAALMLAPMVASSLSATTWFRARPASPEQSTALLVVGCIFASVALIGIGVATARTNPLERTTPRAIAERLAATEGPHRVFNAYNASGVLAAFGGNDIKLAVDGRSDRYGGAYIQEHIDTTNLRGDWDKVFERFDPTVVVIESDQPLARELQDDRGWTLVATDGDYVLLLPPLPRR